MGHLTWPPFFKSAATETANVEDAGDAMESTLAFRLRFASLGSFVGTTPHPGAFGAFSLV